jgi:N4-gp56 family major capsid protein
MAETRAATGLTVEQWDDNYFVEYFQENVFRPYMGQGETSIIQINEDLARKKGDRFTFALVNRLTNAATLGNNTLEGNEEDLSSRSYEIAVDMRRHGVVVPKMENQRSAIDLREAARSALRVWSQEDLRNDVIGALYSVDGVPFGLSSAAQRNTWNANNAGRVLFGNSAGNYNATFATAMATLDNTNDRATAAVMSLAKRRAIAPAAAGFNIPKVRPIEVSGGKRVMIAFCHPLVFRDLATSLQAVNRDAYERGMANPIFTGADLYYEGIVFKEVDDMPILPANATINGVSVGNTVQASPIFLCGAQAVAVAYAQRSRTTTEDFDYGAKAGVAVEEIRGIGKMRYGTGAGDTDAPVDYGVFTAWVAAPADA